MGLLGSMLRAAAIAAVGALAGDQTAHARTAPPPAPVTPPSLQSAAARRLSLQRPAPIIGPAPRGQDSRDLLFFDAIISHPEFGVTPLSVLTAFRMAEAGDPTLQNDLFDGMIEGDCHLRSLFEKREQAVAGKPRVIQAGDASEEGQLAAEVMRTALRDLPLVEAFEHLLRYNRHGYAACEVDWDIRRIGYRDWIVPTWFTPVPPRRFRINYGQQGPWKGPLDELRLFTDYSRPWGDELRSGKWFVLRRQGTTLARAGLMRTGVWPAAGKRWGWRDWVVWLEKFGQPLPVASYDETTDDDSKDIATQLVQQIGETNGAVKPKSITLEFPEARRFGDSGSVHQAEIDHCNSEMSKLVNGSTLTNDNKGSGGASYALGAVHDNVRWEAVQYDAERLETAFETQLARAFCAYNALRCAPPKLKIQVFRDLDPLTRVQVADAYKNKLGGEISRQQMDQELGFREPSGDDDKLPGAPPPTKSIAPTSPPPERAAA